MGRRSLICSALALTLLVSACSRDESADTKAAGRLLRVGITAPSSLDPAQARSFEELLVADQLFGTLTSFDPEKGMAVPALAERWEVSKDQRVWDFFLDADARFSDERACHCGRRQVELRAGSQAGLGIGGRDLLELVSGFPAFGREGSVDQLAGLEVVDDDHLRISLDQPLSVLPIVLSSPTLGVLGRVEGEPDLAAPVSSGPFELAERTEERIRLRPSGRDLELDGIEFRIYDDLGEAYQAFVDGDLDWARVPPETGGRR